MCQEESEIFGRKCRLTGAEKKNTVVRQGVMNHAVQQDLTPTHSSVDFLTVLLKQSVVTPI